jgi:uncharacterized protein involved in outer membrane biogenesis
MASPEALAADSRPRFRIRWGLIALGLVLLFVAMIALLAVAPPSGLITGQVQKKFRDATGRDLTVGSSSYTIRKLVSIELNDVAIANPEGFSGAGVFKAKAIRTSIPLRSVWDGKFDIKDLELDTPEFNLIRDAKGFNNWSMSGPAGSSTQPLALPVTKINNGAVTYTDAATANSIRLDYINAGVATDTKWGGTAAKGTARYKNEPLGFDLNVADTTAALDGRSSVIGLTIDSRHLNAKLNGEGAIGELPMLAGEIEATSPSAQDLAAWLGFDGFIPPELGKITIKSKTDPKTGRATGIGEAVIKGETIAYDLAVADLKGTLGGKPAAIEGRIASKSLTAKVAGVANLGTAKSFDGDIDAKSTSIGSVAKWFGVAHDAVTTLGPGTLKGRAAINGNIVDLTNANFDVDGRKGNFTGRIDATNPRPRVTGTLDTQRIDLAALTGAGSTPPQPTLEASPAEESDPGFESAWDALRAELAEVESGKPATLEAAPAAAKPVWNNDPINLNVLKTVDLDLVVNAAELAFGQLDLKKGRIKTALNNGTLNAKIEELGVSGGKAIGAIDVDGQARPPKAKVALRLTDVPAEPVIKELTGKPLLSGRSNVDITTAATGQTLNQIVSTLEGNARFSMGKGSLRGWDIGRMVSELWNYKGWGFNAQRKTNFDKLLANYNIKQGIVRSAPDLAMTGPEANLNSRGDVIVPTKQIKQEVRVTQLPIPILIKGDWTKKLWIGPTFLAGSSVPSAGAQGAAPGSISETLASLPLPEAVPPDIESAITRLLGKNLNSKILPDAAKARLRKLIVPLSGSGAVPSAP